MSAYPTVYVETCACGARVELSDYLLETSRKEYVEGFRAQHHGHGEFPGVSVIQDALDVPAQPHPISEEGDK